MSKNVAVFVDVANLYYSARGQDVDVDYVALLKAATKGRDLIRAYAYSGLDPENENQRKFIDFLNKNGYKVLTKDIRKFGDGRVKANLDIELVVDLFRLADRMDIAVIISGDGDFAPAIRALQDKGVRCEVISFRPNTSSDLIAVADEFIDIMKIIGIGRGKKDGEKADKVMSAPPMPAKEVVPEFGFREASPSVAAAALAALREGKEPRAEASSARTGRGRGRARPEAAVAEEPVPLEATAVATDAVGDSASTEGAEVRRRRRRRGGRGRGRGRSRTAETSADAATDTPTGTLPEGSGEIGWVELDDLSQLDELDAPGGLGEEREYTFEEADEATLAELGLLDAASAAPDVAAAAPTPGRRSRGGATDAAGARSPRTRKGPAAQAATEEQPAATAASRSGTSRRGRGAATKAASAPADASPEESAVASAEGTAATPAAPRRSRSRTAKPTDEAASADTKPAPRRARSRKAASPEAPAADVPSEGGEDAQGIWQRFRSARGEGRS